jgi:hypothetical protein
MKITAVKPFHISVPYDFGNTAENAAAAQWANMETLFVKVTTDDGVIGWGEGFGLAACGITKVANYGITNYGDSALNPMRARKLVRCHRNCRCEETMKYDFNVLEEAADELVASGRPCDAIKIYLFMADGDPSLDGGYLGKKLAESYEKAGDLHAAKYWYGRAVEENPTARPDCVEARKRLATISIDDLVPAQNYIVR